MPQTKLRTAFPFLVAGLTALAGVLPATKASAHSPYLVVPAPAVAEASAAYRYANMTAAEALAELDKRKVPYKLADPIAGVVSPVRLTGKLHGVYIHSSIPESQRATSVYEVLDARLALALDDFARILSRHDIEEVVHYSLYRPNVPREDHGVKEARVEAAASKAAAAPAIGGAAGKPGAAAASAGSSMPKVAAPALKVAAPVMKASAAPAKASAPVMKAPAPVMKAPAPVMKAAAAPAKAPAPVMKAPAAPAKGPAPAAPPKAAVPGVKPPSALPPPPSSKAFPLLPSKAERAPAPGAKQKTPLAVEKKASPAVPAPPAVKPAAASTANRSASPAGRAVSPRASLTPQKAGAVPVRARAAAPVKLEPKPPAAATAPKIEPEIKHTHTAPATRQTWAAPGTRHPAGLAIDVAMLKKRDGQWVSVATHFRGRIGDKTCGDAARTADTPEARELRSIVCESNDQGVFTYVLTPNFNAAHFDHFHMEIRPQVKWFLYH